LRVAHVIQFRRFAGPGQQFGRDPERPHRATALPIRRFEQLEMPSRDVNVAI
jgi:hypothetical protein